VHEDNTPFLKPRTNYAVSPSIPEAAMSQANDFALSADCELRVLLVDDHDDMLDMMHLFMTRHSYSVATANSGHKALEVVESFAPHIVVSDIGMPEMNGYEMMSRLRAMTQLSPFKAIALTGYDADDNQELSAAGFDAHLTKPIDFDLLFSMIARLTS